MIVDHQKMIVDHQKMIGDHQVMIGDHQVMILDHQVMIVERCAPPKIAVARQRLRRSAAPEDHLTT